MPTFLPLHRIATVLCVLTMHITVGSANEAMGYVRGNGRHGVVHRRELQTPQDGGVGITGLELIYTGKEPHEVVQTLAFNKVNVIDLATLGLIAAKFNIHAIRTGSTVNSVKFSNGQFEGFVPFAYCANVGPVYKTCTDLIVGATVTILITPYPLPNFQGTPFPTLSTTIQIINTAKTPTLTPTRSPVVATTILPSQCSIPKLEGNSWQSGTEYALNVAESQGAMIDQSFVIVSGFHDAWTATTVGTHTLDTTNPSATWQAVDNLPAAPGITHSAFVVIGTKFYMCGGYVSGTPGPQTNKCLVYDHSMPSGQQWSSIAPLPDTGRAGGGLVFDTASKVLIFSAGATRAAGGIHAIDHNSTWVYSFNAPDNGWVSKAPIPFLGNHISFVTAKDGAGLEHHYFSGGQTEENEYDGNNVDHYEYLVSTDTWVVRKSLPMPRGHASSSTHAYGCGYLIIGGCTNGGLKVSDVTYYSIATDTWTKIGDLPSAINTPVCDINRQTNTLYCETGHIGWKFSHKRQITV